MDDAYYVNKYFSLQDRNTDANSLVSLKTTFTTYLFKEQEFYSVTQFITGILDGKLIRTSPFSKV